MEKSMQNEELKKKPEVLLNCPFCGGEAKVNLFLGNYCVTCNECMGAIFPAKGMTEKEAIKLWNTRRPMERIIERIENARQKYQRLVREQGEKEDEAMNIHFRGVMQIVKEEGGIE